MEYGPDKAGSPIQMIHNVEFCLRSMLNIVDNEDIESIVYKRKKDTLSAENIREGIVKGRRLGPPLIICFFTVHIILSKVSHKLGVGVDRETELNKTLNTLVITLNISSGSLL